MEIVASVSRITEYDLEPLLENMLNQFPFYGPGISLWTTAVNLLIVP